MLSNSIQQLLLVIRNGRQEVHARTLTSVCKSGIDFEWQLLHAARRKTTATNWQFTFHDSDGLNQWWDRNWGTPGLALSTVICLLVRCSCSLLLSPMSNIGRWLKSWNVEFSNVVFVSLLHLQCHYQQALVCISQCTLQNWVFKWRMQNWIMK